MQRRMAAGFAKELKHGKDTTIINYAPYRPYLTAKNGPLRFIRHYWGLWDIEHYIDICFNTLAVGECKMGIKKSLKKINTFERLGI